MVFSLIRIKFQLHDGSHGHIQMRIFKRSWIRRNRRKGYRETGKIQI